MQQRESPEQFCAFCGFEIPTAPVESTDGRTCCSDRCREASAADEQPHAGRFGFKQFYPGVAALDALLPWGMPANSFVLLAGHEGIRHRGLQTELVWRALRRGERAIMISYVDPPVAVADHFLTFGWNVLPYLEAGDLHIIDCFSNRLREEHQSPSHQIPWNDHLDGFLEDAVSTISDTTNLRSVENSLHETLRDQEMIGSGLVVIDSLNEIELQSHEHGTEQFIKEIRADVCNRNFVPIFASTTLSEHEDFARGHAYLFDGIVDMQREESIIPGSRIKELSVRKMDGVRYRPEWAAYENAGHGFELYDPHTDFEMMYPTAPGRPMPSRCRSPELDGEDP